MPEPDMNRQFKILAQCKSELLKASSEEKARIYVRMGDAYNALKKGNKARICYQEAYEAGNLDPDFILKYAQQLADAGKAADAIAVMRKAIDSAEDPVVRTRLMIKSGLVTRLVGNFDDGIEMGQKALELVTGLKVDPKERKALEAEANTVIAQNLWRKGRFERAGRYLENALEIYNELEDDKGTANAYNLLGIINSLSGNQRKALDYYTRSIEARDLARCYINMGIVKHILGEFKDSEEDYKTALKKGRKEGYKIAIHLAQLNLAELYIDKGNLPKAKTFMELSLQGYKEMSENPRIALVYDARSRIFLLEGDIDMASKDAETALSLANRYGIKDIQARMFHTLGKIEMEKKTLEKARAYLERAVDLMKEIKLVRYIGKALTDLAVVNRELGHKDKAKEVADEARKVLEAQEAKFFLKRLKELGF